MCFVLTGSLAAARGVWAQTPIESSHEARFQFDFKVPDAALAAFLPTGFTPDVATQGPAKDCNLRVVFIDRVTINGPDNQPGTPMRTRRVADMYEVARTAVLPELDTVFAEATEAMRRNAPAAIPAATAPVAPAPALTWSGRSSSALTATSTGARSLHAAKNAGGTC